MQDASRALGVLFRVHLACWILYCESAAFAQTAPLITEVRIEQEGRLVDDRLVTGLIETTVGEPLSMRDVRETLTHLTSLNRYEDVQVLRESASGGVRLRYVLVPLHPVDRMEFRGMLGLPEDQIRPVITERFGAAPPAARAEEIAEALRVWYSERGYPTARVTPRVEETHAPDRATLAFDIEVGTRATIGRLDIDEVDATDRHLPPADIGVRVGDPYDNPAILQALDRYVASLRTLGFYEARGLHTATFDGNGKATVRVTVDRGPLVTVAFAGDPLPEADRERLVPVRAEGSADEDLLEDATLAIEDYLRARGYRDAEAEHARDERDGMLTITFTVRRGARFVVDGIAISGNSAVPTADLVKLVPIEAGQPLVQTAAGRAALAIRDLYRSRGFTRVTVQITASELPPNDGGGAGERRVTLRFNVIEGARTLLSSIVFQGNTVMSDAQLDQLMPTAPGRPYSEADIVAARDRIDIEYRNRGYESVVVEPEVSLADDGTRADVRFAINEGQQVVVDHVIIVGNRRTSTETIERELLLRPGQPLGYSARIESQQRLAALGLFRRVAIEELRHAGEPRRDVLIQVEEAPPTTIGYGGGVEGGTRLRPTGEGGQAEERFEFAPRGFFEIGRRNLWGKNRAVNLFGRVSLRSRDIVLSESGIRFDQPAEGSGYGFNEYRVLATFREPKVLNTPADVLVTGILDQAIRSSFNFITREARAEAGVRVGPLYNLAGRYSYEHTRLFDERFTEAEKPLIDRVFPQVRISKFSASLIRDTRNDVLDPDSGTLAILDSQLAARMIGSEVGFTRTFVEGFAFYRLPAERRLVLALGSRVGIAHGFRRTVPRLGPDGQPITDAGGTPVVDVVEDLLPASERFFAGGDTTVRGFSLDRLGTPATISSTGFPTGGNGLVVLNAEMRVALVGGLGAVGFLDAGNVFLRARDLDLGQLRGAAGFGIRYRSPVGPIRIDMGFKLDRRELAPGRLERSNVLHISLGQAF
jgi:outer membrane protein insertion porin family